MNTKICTNLIKMKSRWKYVKMINGFKRKSIRLVNLKFYWKNRRANSNIFSMYLRAYK